MQKDGFKGTLHCKKSPDATVWSLWKNVDGVVGLAQSVSQVF